MISTFIACHNHGKYVEEAARSCLDQSLPPTELILINDASTDDTKHIMTSLWTDPRVKILNHYYRRGNIASYNEGIEKCKGKYIHLMAADDRLASRQFYLQAQNILEDKEIGFVTGRLVHINDQGIIISNTFGPPFVGKVASPSWLSSLAENGNFICGGAVIVRKELQKDYDERLPFSADFLNWIHILDNCKYAYALPWVVYLYRRHGGQMTAQKSASDRERTICRKELERVIQKYENQLILGEKDASKVKTTVEVHESDRVGKPQEERIKS